MSGHKQIEQQLKRPDTFQQTIMKGINYATSNPARVVKMLTPLILIALVGYGIQSWRTRQANHRRAEIAKIFMMQTDENNAVVKQQEATRKEIDALRNPADAKPDATGKKPELTADTLLKISALEKKLTDTKPDHAGSTTAFKKFYDGNKNNAEGWLAGMSWAGYQLEHGKVADVKPVLEEITKVSLDHKFYQIQSRFMLANVLEELGEFDAALKEAEVLTSLVDDEGRPMILLLKGQLLYFKKDAGARAVLTEIVDKHGSTKEAQTARSLLSEMGPV